VTLAITTSQPEQHTNNANAKYKKPQAASAEVVHRKPNTTTNRHKTTTQCLKHLYSLAGHSNIERTTMTSQDKIVLNPIGIVKTEAANAEVKEKDRTSQIIIKPELTKALNGITGFSHLFVLFWLNEISTKERKTLKVHPRGRKDMPLLGVFATRTKLRPNPIGLTLVELVKANGNVLTVRGLDAFNETPIIDIKPFDLWDTAKEARVPQWWLKLEKEKVQKP